MRAVIHIFKHPVALNKPIPANQLQGTPSRAASINESLYFNRASFIPRANQISVLRGCVHVDDQELQTSGAAGGIEQ
ncbi:hypothetical protein PtA15_4A320 [Puccinia triticina]|uniref:Uncharacterized protein n=1 Tax=Puccinia triticina TaxID=208348 RepID=A0ABY7CF80_9BASI|nr:uncharacterized protein PtA15_4A320 [Puccinia triticina]WAQ83871.1 hypothetical protein PtA15_4A320 [Puccinia triticina]WAR54716.1 hypothetical protein PtB15_4B333 [Puccinia triticina]